MPWKKKRIYPLKPRLLLLVLAAAAACGVLACFVGSLLHSRGSALAARYSAYKAVTGSYSEAEIRAALEKRAAAGR